ncbi:hypothetical protein Sjap_002649 [Stephania japonica]|uniref:Uncharacterized protein n=1 Tax=Stephania japonica TaxID=461633 RepID=A0AAP0PUQ6_9MAGN
MPPPIIGCDLAEPLTGGYIKEKWRNEGKQEEKLRIWPTTKKSHRIFNDSRIHYELLYKSTTESHNELAVNEEMN